jgi:heme/copper-type cytochrome/quinol oxidase subunit 4
MNIHSNFKDHVCRFVVSAGIISLAMPAMPNPIPLAKNSIMPEIFFLTAFAILLEVMCINLVLRRSRRPSFFILWLIGMHLITYPSFLGFLWLLQDMRPAFATAIGEGLVVLIEGGVIYLICLFVASARPQLPSPSLAKCWLHLSAIRPSGLEGGVRFHSSSLPLSDLAKGTLPEVLKARSQLRRAAHSAHNQAREREVIAEQKAFRQIPEQTIPKKPSERIERKKPIQQGIHL